MTNHKRAFTLTELLVVVVVIGILAAVSVPKFNRMLESRRTTEAEELMAAVRTQQEKRCTFEKPYASNFQTMGPVISSKPAAGTTEQTSNYSYRLEELGITAQSNRKDYSLKILSYKDGRLCCSGSYCAELNKSYPSCDELVVAEDTCAALSCDPALKPSSECSMCGTQSVTCNTLTGVWKAGTCTGGGSCEPGASRPCGVNGRQVCTPACGWGKCNDNNCVGPNKQTCNSCGNQTRTCDTETGVWNPWDTCSVASVDECPAQTCTEGQLRGYAACNGCGNKTTEKCVKGEWIPWEGACSKTVKECTPECSYGETRGSQACNDCGKQTTEECVSGTWQPSLGKCSVGTEPGACTCENPPYVAEHKSQCCPAQPKVNGACWYDSGTWVTFTPDPANMWDHKFFGPMYGDKYVQMASGPLYNHVCEKATNGDILIYMFQWHRCEAELKKKGW